MILIFGATGYVGSAFQRLFKARNLSYRTVPRMEPDYHDRSGLSALLKQTRPSSVINCAGFTGRPNVDACEFQQMDCLQMNAVFPRLLREVCEEEGIPWGHISSGCIFTSDRGTDAAGNVVGFTEEDAPNFSFRQNNCSFYSGTKALGEEVLGYRETPQPDGRRSWEIKGGAKGYIWRLRIPFNELASPRNYLSRLVSYPVLLEARNSLTQIDEAVRACWECQEKRVPFGIYNMTNPGSITTREVVALIQSSPLGKNLRLAGKHFAFFRDETEFMEKAAIAPRSNCVLDTHKLAATGIHMTPVAQAIEQSLQDWKENQGSKGSP